MNKQPATVFNDINTEIQNVYKSNGVLTEFEVSRIKKQINNLLKIDPRAAYTLHGMLSAVMHDYNSMVENHEKALKIAPSDHNANTNYAVSLTYFGCFIKAFEILEQLHHKYPDDLDVIYSLIEYAYDSGNYPKAQKYFNILKQLSKEKSEDFEDHIELLGNYISEHDLSDNEISDIVNIVESLIREDISQESNYLFRGVDFNIQEDDEDSWISLKYFITAGVNKIVDLNFKVADVLIESGVRDKVLNNFTIQFAPGDV